MIPYTQAAYSVATGTSKIPAFIFESRDPSTNDYNPTMTLYTGWVNTITKAVWYLEALVPSNGLMLAQWRAVGPVVVASVNPTVSDYQYPIGQTWINEVGMTYWGLVNVTGTTATWEELSSGVSSGILTLTGNSGGAVSGDGARNLNVLGTSGQIDVVGNPGTNTLTLSLAGGGMAIDAVTVDSFTGPGTNPVLPNASGEITVTGGQVVSGTTNNAIRTSSLAANTYTIQVQRSAATASANANLNGVCHFNETDFSVDNNGFVSTLSSGFTRLVEVDTATGPGTDPVTPTALGVITVTGGQVAAATTPNVIRTASLAANTYTVQVQRSKASASSTVGDNGVCHFNSSHFTVDANGWVSATGSGGGIAIVNVQTFTSNGTYTPTSGMVYCWVQVVGGGGGGGGASIDGGDAAESGSGGGGGLYASKVFPEATIGASKAVTVGSGGAGGIGKNDGADGGTTTFGALISVSGGVKGLYMRASGPVQEGGDGGQALVGTVDYSSFGGGGGYSINAGGAVVSGAGGSSLLSSGGKPRATAADGVAGGGYGGGGSGGVAAIGVPATGGSGSAGVVIVTEYIV